MFYSVLIIIIAAAIFLAAIISVASKGSVYNRIIGYVILFTGIIGILLYGYGYAFVYAGKPFLAMVKSVIGVIGMFIGRNEFSAIKEAPLMQYMIVELLFWIAHFGALYAFASAVIVNLGADALAHLRMALSRRGRLVIIYGVNQNSLSVGRTLKKDKSNSVVYIGTASSMNAQTIREIGSVLVSDADKFEATAKKVKKIGVNKRRSIWVYCLSREMIDNISFADGMMAAMQEIGVEPENTRLIINGFEDELASRYQALGDEKYGFGNVLIFEESALTARELVRNHLPAETISFDSDGKAKENFEALIVGFGKSGNFALHYLILNGMFEGSDFKADVFAKDCGDVSGCILNRCLKLDEHYNVNFHTNNAKSREFFNFLSDNYKTLKYIVLCCGEAENEEISREISLFLKHKRFSLPIYSLTRTSFITKDPSEALLESWKLYESDSLVSEKTDKLAMAYNQYYCQSNGKSMEENWKYCDSFSRDSCRAAADFLPSMLTAIGTDEEHVLADGFSCNSAQELNLAKTEHLRWCAFHYMNNYETMSDEEFDSRSETYKQEVSENGKANIRIAKNTVDKTHACLIPWDELDALAEKENAITNGHVDYKQADINNILVIPEALKIAEDKK